MSNPLLLDVQCNGRPWLTENQRLHWGERARRVRAWREAAFWRAKAERLPRLERALVVCELHFSTRHRRDANNWNPTSNSCLDGLVDAGVFDDDWHAIVTGPDMRIGEVVPRSAIGLRLYLRPLEG